MPRPSERSVVCIGNFDGVHLGHRELIERTLAHATPERKNSILLTFDPHPVAFFAADKAPLNLTPLHRKLELVGETGIHTTVVEPFDRVFSQLPPEAFVRDVLWDSLRAQHVIVGEDFCYGRDRQGTVQTLVKAGRDIGFDVSVVQKIRSENNEVSSSAIRRALAKGDLALANRLLDRPHDVEGRVVRGEQRGRELGFPTANVSVERCVLPATGIYAVWVERLSRSGNVQHMGAASLGTNPTFAITDETVTLEVYLLDFDEDLYGETIRVFFAQFLRPEMRYEGTAPLVAQIRHDVAETRRVLGTQNPP